MKANLLLHPLTETQVAAFLTQPSHAVLLTGPTGVGKRVIADHLAAEILETTQVHNYPYLRVIQPEAGKAISIEAIRELEHFLSLKVPTQNTVNRAVIIEDSHLMTTEAQNALLKTLEEPPQGTVVILTAVHEQALLPTIRSRAQTLAIKRPDHDALAAYFDDKGFATQHIEQSYAMSGGLPGLMHALLEDAEHPLVEATKMARGLLSQTVFERLSQVDELSRNRQLSEQTLFILQQMAHVSLQKTSRANAKRWQQVLQATYEAATQLASSGQPKLVLTNLMLHF